MGRQRVVVSVGDYRELRISFLEMHKFPLFSSKQLKLAYVSEREIDREKRSGNRVPKFSWVSSRTQKNSLLV